MAQTGWIDDATSTADGAVELPPTEDELPYDDGVPMETQQHLLQMHLLIETLALHFAGRSDVFVGGNMFVHFNLVRALNRDFRGPDFFVALGVPHRLRKSRVIWQEPKGPDVVVELLSDSTAEVDKGEKKQVYQEQLRVPEYFWHDPFSDDRAGFVLVNGLYRAIEPDEQGRLVSQKLGLALAVHESVYQGYRWPWLRWETLDGRLLPTAEESSTRAQRQAEEAQRQVEEAQRQAEEAQRQQAELESLLARYRERFGELDGS